MTSTGPPAERHDSGTPGTGTQVAATQPTEPSQPGGRLLLASMALAGPVGERLGMPMTFLLAGETPVLLAAVAILAWRLPRDEIEHPLDAPAAPIRTG